AVAVEQIRDRQIDLQRARHVIAGMQVDAVDRAHPHIVPGRALAQRVIDRNVAAAVGVVDVEADRPFLIEQLHIGHQVGRILDAVHPRAVAQHVDARPLPR
ncbi:hypothetical protein CSC81_18895, partial [Tenacibaculum discolor]